MAKKDFKKNPAEMFMSAASDPLGADAEENMDQEEDPAAGLVIPKGYKLTKETKSERMQLLVRPTLKAELKAEAAAQGLSMNDLVNNIFEEYLKERGL